MSSVPEGGAQEVGQAGSGQQGFKEQRGETESMSVMNYKNNKPIESYTQYVFYRTFFS